MHKKRGLRINLQMQPVSELSDLQCQSPACLSIHVPVLKTYFSNWFVKGFNCCCCVHGSSFRFTTTDTNTLKSGILYQYLFTGIYLRHICIINVLLYILPVCHTLYEMVGIPFRYNYSSVWYICETDMSYGRNYLHNSCQYTLSYCTIWRKMHVDVPRRNP